MMVVLLRSCVCLFVYTLLVSLLPVDASWSEKPDWPDSLKKTKKPNEFVEWGWDLRIRDERMPDALDRNPDNRDPIREWMRIRSRLFADFKLADNLKLKTRMINESRPILSPDHYTSANPYDRYDHFDEVLMDNLYLELKTESCLPVIWRIGRQDMLAMPGMNAHVPMGNGFGTGLILMDGTPGDGSRSFFFDAARATIDLDDVIAKSSLDIIALDNDSYAHDHFPDIANNNYQRLSEWDSQAFILYFKNASWLPKTQYDVYYIYKDDDQVLRQPWEKSTKPGVVTNTTGMRFSGDLWQGASYEAEGAFQWGDKDGHDVRAFASQESVQQAYEKCLFKPKLKLFHVYLSGDDPDTDTVEAWQQVYGRWPKWGELIGYMGAQEDGVYYFTNMNMVGGQVDMVPCENWTMTGLVQALWADENTYRGRTGFSDNGLYRGLNPQAKIEWAPTKFLTCHLLYEWWVSGDYMADRADDGDYSFFRWEVSMKF